MKPSQSGTHGIARWTGSSRRHFLAAAGAASASIAFPRVAAATSSFPALAGRTVTMIIGSDIGGGYDLFGRAIARHLQRLVPGLQVNIQNIGKAGGKLAAKTIQDGPPDGSLIAMLPVSLMSAQILQEEGVAYDVASWSWIGKLASEARLYLAGPGADFATIADLRARGTIAPMAVRSTSSFAYYEAMCVNAMLGIKVKPVPGYKSGEKEQAMMSGADLSNRIHEILSDEERLRADLGSAFTCGKSLSEGAVGACHQS